MLDMGGRIAAASQQKRTSACWFSRQRVGGRPYAAYGWHTLHLVSATPSVTIGTSRPSSRGFDDYWFRTQPCRALHCSLAVRHAAVCLGQCASLLAFVCLCAPCCGLRSLWTRWCDSQSSATLKRHAVACRRESGSQGLTNA